MKIDLAELEKRVEERWLYKRPHPTLPLVLWNYTQETAYANQWDEYTMMCRGLITDMEGNIVQRPLRKFFNLNQRPETMMESLPAEEPHITVKLDGSLGILYFTPNGPAMATRGSFESDQALWATDWIRKQKLRAELKAGYTYCFEILYKENRIVVDYAGREECVLLAVINVEDGSEISAAGEGMRLGLNWVDIVVADSIEELQKKCETLSGNEEGFVVRYPSGLRVKMKGAEYVRLHRIVTQCSARRVWECLSAGTPLEEWLDRVPDELFQWAKGVRSALLDDYTEIEMQAYHAADMAKMLPTRKEGALYLQEHHKGVMHLAFSVLDGKLIGDAIWRRLRPAHELPFMKEVESE